REWIALGAGRNDVLDLARVEPTGFRHIRKRRELSLADLRSVNEFNRPPVARANLQKIGEAGDLAGPVRSRGVEDRGIEEQRIALFERQLDAVRFEIGAELVQEGCEVAR